MLQRATKTVQALDDEGIPVAELLQGFGKTRAFSFGSGGGICVPRCAAGCIERMELQVEGLFPGGNSGVTNLDTRSIS
jgi:hypothetical protein